MITLNTIDAHVAGAALRLVVGGFPAARGKTMHDKRVWAGRHADHLRRVLMLEPRGHADMCGAVLTEPTQPGSHAGLLFMDPDGFGPLCGHGVIAAATIAVERGLLTSADGTGRLVFDTPAGTVRANAVVRGLSATGGSRVRSVSFSNVPSFVLHPGLEVVLPGRRLRADIAFGGAFYAIVDAEAAGVPVDGARLGNLRRVGREIIESVEGAMRIVHPTDPTTEGLDGVILTAPPRQAGADLRNATVSASGAVDRSPSGTGTAAVMAVLDAMGLLADDRPFIQESLIGTTLAGRLTSRTCVGALDAVVVEVEGSAWLTGDHTFLVDDDDPIGEGFRLA